MPLNDIINTIKKLEHFQGVERDLLKRQRAGTIGWLIALAGAIHQVLLIIFEEKYLSDIINKPLTVAKDRPGQLIGLVILIIGLGIYFAVKRTKILLKESEEPFRYTFWIKPFESIKDTPGERFKLKNDDRFHLLHHDLIERLNGRIRRLSLLDSSLLKANDTVEGKLTSHIHIEGHYAIREKRHGEWIVHVMPRVRIGPSTNPAVLATPVKFNICKVKDNKSADENANDKIDENEKPDGYNLDADLYNQIVERIYSSIATEIYRQIELDLKEKITLFPTHYLRACAYYYEAEDFARSNTIDGYDRAIELYKEALRYFNIANIKPITNFFLKFPLLLWRKEVEFVHMQSRVKIGYAKCLIYRRILSALSGRYKNPLFAIRSELDEVINNLLLLHNRINKEWKLILPNKNADTENKEKRRLSTIMAFLTFPKDTWAKYLTFGPSRYLFERQSHLLFDAYVVTALTHHQLGAIQKAKDYLEDAKSISPLLSDKNALFLFASGEIEPEIDKAVFLLRKATEIAPDFQIAQYSLAYYCEMKFRMQNEIEKERADSTIKEYEMVLELNPGNIASLAAQGYLYWLFFDPKIAETLEYLDKAKKNFEEGCEVKAIVRETFIGQLSYGLARIAAEEGDFNRSLDKYNEAISADPGVGAYSATTDRLSTAPYYDYIDSNMLKRYKNFKENVENKINDKQDKFTQNTVEKVFSYVLNDYGNACLSYFHRFGDMEKLEEAIKAFEQTIEKYPENKGPHFNLQNAYAWRNKEGDIERGIECLQKIKSHEGPIWPVALITLVQSLLRQKQDDIKVRIQKVDDNTKEIKNTINDLSKKSKYRLSGVPEEISQGSQAAPKLTGLDKTENIGDSVIEKQKKIQELKKKARKEYDDLERELSEYLKSRLAEIKDNNKRTKLSSIYEGFEFKEDGQGVDKFLSEKKEIERGRFDEYDMDALRFWAEVLSNNFPCLSARNAAKELCEYIEDEYYPDNFDTNWILHDMYARVKGVTEIESILEDKVIDPEMEECDKKISHYAEVIKPTIEDWLKRDPNKYTSLIWAKYFFEEKELIKFFERATKNAVIQNELGDIYYSRGKYGEYEKVKEQYTKATKLAPEIPRYECDLGQTYGELDQWENAIEHHQKAVELRRQTSADPDGLDHYYEYLAEAYFKADKLEEFEDEFERSGDLRNEPEKKAIIYNKIGDLLSEEDKYQEATRYYKKAIAFNKQPIYLYYLGRAYGNLRKWDKVIKHCKKAVELWRTSPTDVGLDFYYEYLSEAYFKANRLEEFEDEFERSGDLRDKPEKKAIIYNKIGDLLSEEDKYQEATRYYEKAKNLHNLPIYECKLGISYGKIEDWNRMIDHCGRAIKLRRAVHEDYYDLDYYYGFLAEAYFKANRLEEFEDEFERSGDLRDKPEKEAMVFNRIGDLLASANKDIEAIPYYQKAIELDKENPFYECNLGRAYGNLGQWDNMIVHGKRALELSRETPTDPYGLDPFYGFLGEAYLKADRLKEFEDEFERSGDLRDKPEKEAMVFNRIGDLLFEMHRHQDAVLYYKKAIEHDPNNDVYLANIEKCKGF